VNMVYTLVEKISKINTYIEMLLRLCGQGTSHNNTLTLIVDRLFSQLRIINEVIINSL
jgi:hypothetical protein